jgi:large subunit ribosomal protein L31
MKEKIHPKYEKVKVVCACGHEFETRSTIGSPEIRTEICSSCHPFFTGKQKLMDSAGRVEKFNKKFGRTTGADGKAVVAEPTAVKAKVETKPETKVETKPKAEAKPAAKAKATASTEKAGKDTTTAKKK